VDRTFFHIDLDAFFAAVEIADNPSLKGKPVVVGAAPGHRGVVSTCSYEARTYGIHSAQPVSEAFRLCPRAIFLPVRMHRYTEVSEKIMMEFRTFTPDVSQISIDEASLDMTGTEKLWGNRVDAGIKIKKHIKETTGLNVSIGIASNRYVAKIASGIGKPDGLLVVESGKEAEFFRTLPIDKLWGVGEVTRKVLKGIGVTTIEELQSISHNVLASKLGKAAARFLHEASWGRDPGIYEDRIKSRSISGERTFENDTTDIESLENTLRRLSDELSTRLFDSGEDSHTLSLKIRFSDFSLITRQCTKISPYGSSDQIFEDSLRLLKRNWDGLNPIRLVGLGLHDLCIDENSQNSLFPEELDSAEITRRVVESIKKRGKGKFVRARFLDRNIENLQDNSK
jgi:DNA polymerase-4